jgi:signal transduction histidine kinase
MSAALCLFVARAYSQEAQEETLGGPDSHETGQGPHGHLFGEWGGERTRLLERGVRFDFQYVSDSLWNIKSEQKQYYFIPPLRSFAIKLHDLPFNLTFFGCQVFAIWLVTKRKRTEDCLRQANAVLVAEMAERERAEDSLRSARSELARVMRVTTVGELTASIAHEINQPLAAVATNSDACIAWLESENPNLPEARSCGASCRGRNASIGGHSPHPLSHQQGANRANSCSAQRRYR